METNKIALPPIETTTNHYCALAQARETPPVCDICGSSNTYEVGFYDKVPGMVTVWYTRTLHQEKKVLPICRECHLIMAAVDDLNWPTLKEFVKKVKEQAHDRPSETSPTDT